MLIQLYDKYRISEESTTHLVALYEDRLRHDCARRCEDCDFVNLEEEAVKVNKSILNACKTRIETVLKNAGINAKGWNSESPPEVIRNADDSHAIALAKMQANIESARED